MIQSIAPFANRSPLFRVALGVGIFAIALAARFALLPVNANVAFATFYPATVFAFFLCGTGPGLVNVALSAVAGLYIFSPPNWSWNFGWRGVVAASAYLISSLLIAWIVHKLQSTFGELRSTLQKLGETSNDLQDLYDHAPCGYYSLDAHGRFLRLNDVVLSWLGCSRADALSGLKITEFFTDESKALFADNFARFLAEGRIGPLEFDLISRQGKSRRVVVQATAVKDRNGRFLKSRSAMYDISELDRVRRELQRLNREQNAMLDNELVGIVKLRDRQAIWKNRALERIFGYERGELDNQPARKLYIDDESYRALGEAAYPVLARGETFRTQLMMARKNGAPMWIDMSGVLLSEKPDESIWFMLDITAMKQREAQIEQIAFHDALTGLANRILLFDRLRQSILLRERLRGLLAVCFIDLDGFKAVNDRYGHEAGDDVLKTIAGRLRAAVRGTDTVARIGGDEFIVMLTPIQSREECYEICHRIETVISEPVAISEKQCAQLSASIGVAFCPEDGTTADALLSHADQAMYDAKRDARNLRKSPRRRAP